MIAFVTMPLFQCAGAPVVLPLRGSHHGHGGVPRPLHRRRLHAALLQTAVGETHHAGRHGVRRPGPPQQPRLDPVRLLASKQPVPLSKWSQGQLKVGGHWYRCDYMLWSKSESSCLQVCPVRRGTGKKTHIHKKHLHIYLRHTQQLDRTAIYWLRRPLLPVKLMTSDLRNHNLWSCQ